MHSLLSSLLGKGVRGPEAPSRLRMSPLFPWLTHHPERFTRTWPWFVLLAQILFFSLAGPGFFSVFNLQNVATDMSFMLLIAIGQTFVVIAGGLDLSSGYVMGLASVVAAQFMINLSPHLPLFVVLPLAIVGGVLVGSAAGFISGTIIARLSVSPFVTTLGMLGIAQGVGYVVAKGSPLSVPGLSDLGSAHVFYILPGWRISWFSLPPHLSIPELRGTLGILPLPLVVSLVVVVIFAWLLARTRFGLHTYAIGGNHEAARRAGITVTRHTIVIYVISAALAALAGVLYMVRNSTGSTDAGSVLLLDSVAAVVIGGTSLAGGEGTILGTLAGALIIAMLQNGLVIVGIDPFWQYIATGIVVIVAIIIYRRK